MHALAAPPTLSQNYQTLGAPASTAQAQALQALPQLEPPLGNNSLSQPTSHPQNSYPYAHP